MLDLKNHKYYRAINYIFIILMGDYVFQSSYKNKPCCEGCKPVYQELNKILIEMYNLVKK